MARHRGEGDARHGSRRRPARRGAVRHRRRRRATSTSPTRMPSTRRSRATTWSSTRPPGRPSTTPRSTSRGPRPSTARPPGCSPARPGRTAPPWCRSAPTTCSTAPPARRTPRTRRLSPASAYGRTKAEGEQAVREEHPDGHLIVRTAWLYGAHGAASPRPSPGLAREPGPRRRRRRPGRPADLDADVAELLVDLVQSEAPAGTYHATSSGQCSWFDFARTSWWRPGWSPRRCSRPPARRSCGPRRGRLLGAGPRGAHRARAEPIGDWEERWAESAPAVLAEHS